jgi:hypothetical protein
MPDSMLERTTTAPPPAHAERAHLRATVMVYAAVQFVVLTVIGMAIYPGGSMANPRADRYVFMANFFSDLGATVTQSGASNRLACALFIAALGSVGAALIFFSSSWKFLTDGVPESRRMGRFSQVAGVLSGLCLIGIAATPHNLAAATHMNFVKSAFVLLLGFIAPFTYLQAVHAWPRAYVRLGALYVVTLLAYVVNLFIGPSVRTPFGFSFQVVTQKAIVYYSIATVAVLALAVRRQALAYTTRTDAIR